MRSAEDALPLAHAPLDISSQGMSQKMRLHRTMRTRYGIPFETSRSDTRDVFAIMFSIEMSPSSSTTKSETSSPSGPTPISRNGVSFLVICASIRSRKRRFTSPLSPMAMHG